MIRRLLVVAVLVAVAFVVYHNRHRVAVLAGLGSPEIRITGDWSPVRSGFKEDEVYNFTDELISRGEEVVGQYDFKGYKELEVTMGEETTLYEVEFPDDETMDWYREVKGERTRVRRWRR